MFLAFTAGQIFLLVVSAVLLYASTLGKTKRSRQVQGEDFDTRVRHNSYLPVVIGRNKIGPVILRLERPFVGTPPQDQGKGQGGTGAQQDYFEARGIHGLYVGVGGKLLRIFENETVIFDGEISLDTTPSGTAIVTSDGSVFRIYWGETAQPNGDLRYTRTDGSFQLIGGWGFVRVEWDTKKLGISNRWAELKYEVEGPVVSGLVASQPYLPRTWNNTVVTFATIYSRFPYFDWIETDPYAWRGGVTKGFGNPNPNVPTGCSYQTFLANQANPSTRWRHWIVDRLPDQIPNNIPASRLAFLNFNYYRNSGNISPFNNPEAQLPDFGRGRVIRIAGTGYFWFPTQTNSTSARTIAGQLPEFLVAPNTVYARVVVPTVSQGFIDFPNLLPPLTGGYWSGACMVEFLLPEEVDRIVETAHPTAPSNIVQIQPLREEVAAGVNPAHILDQVLFAPWPNGAGLPRSQFDIRSLEECAVRLEAERLRGAMRVDDSQTWQDAADAVMQDAGIVFGWDVETERHIFELLRSQSVRPTITTEMLLNRPERLVGLLPVQPDRVVFSYLSASRGYRETTFLLRNDAIAVDAPNQDSKSVDIRSTHDDQTAVRIGRRREVEVFGSQQTIRVELTRDGRYLRPGTTVELPDGRVVRIRSRQPDILSDKTTLECILDPLDELNTAIGSEGGEMNNPGDSYLAPQRRPVAVAEDNVEVRIVDAPRGFLGIGGPTAQILVPVARGTDQVVSHDIYISRDGTTYTRLGNQPIGWVEVVLEGPLAAADVAAVSVRAGLDIQRVPSLIGDPAWETGRLFAVLENDGLTEVVFLDGLQPDPSDDDLWEIPQLRRGQWATAAQDWPAGTKLLISQPQSIRAWDDIAGIVPGYPLFVKAQPIGVHGARPLELVEERAYSAGVLGNEFMGSSIGGLPIVDLEASGVVGGETDLSWAVANQLGGDFVVSVYETNPQDALEVTTTTLTSVRVDAAGTIGPASPGGVPPASYYAMVRHRVNGILGRPAVVQLPAPMPPI